MSITRYMVPGGRSCNSRYGTVNTGARFSSGLLAFPVEEIIEFPADIILGGDQSRTLWHFKLCAWSSVVLKISVPGARNFQRDKTRRADTRWNLRRGRRSSRWRFRSINRSTRRYVAPFVMFVGATRDIFLLFFFYHHLRAAFAWVPELRSPSWKCCIFIDTKARKHRSVRYGHYAAMFARCEKLLTFH